jgi:lantibiotic biosynthesis protein
MGWSPILAGADEQRAWRALEILVEALRDPGAAGGEVSLARGEAGIALFFGYLARVTGRGDLARLAQDRLGVAIDRVIADPPHPFLFGGITGVAWVAEHLAGMGPDPGGEDPHEEIDRMIGELLDNPLESVRFELMRGVAGFGVYALERLPRPSAAAALARVVGALADMADPDGASWLTTPPRMPTGGRARHPASYRSLGVGHGVTGPIAVLAAACAHRVAEERAGPLCRRAIDALWNQRRQVASDDQLALPALAGQSEPARVSWCHGDAGVGAALLAAAPAARDRALELCRRAARQAPQGDDAGLSQGAAGLAHIFHRCHQATGEPLFSSASRAWYARLLDLLDPRAARGGLQGGAGIGLALLAAVTSTEPAWDRVMLLSVRRPGGGDRLPRGRIE